MTTLNSTLNSDTDTGLSATASQHGSEALFGDNPPQATADIGVDIVGSASLDYEPLAPPQSNASSSKSPPPDANNASGSKRKLEDREPDTDDRKKPKQDNSDERTSSLITPRHIRDIAGVESLVNVCDDVYWQSPLLIFSAEAPPI